jgi:4'-phosphopantetheinyl transferase EntD
LTARRVLGQRVERTAMLDAAHPTVDAFRGLLPEAIVVGGAFDSALPHPAVIERAERFAALRRAQEAAARECLSSLLQAIATPEEHQDSRRGNGTRVWPKGYVGSLTHKGTVVIGAAAALSAVRMLGIDLERNQKTDLDLNPDEIAPDGLPPGADVVRRTLIAFSAKEAVFKAQFPSSGRRLSFADVRLEWSADQDGVLRGFVRAPDVGIQVRCQCVVDWVLSAAIAL